MQFKKIEKMSRAELESEVSQYRALLAHVETIMSNESEQKNEIATLKAKLAGCMVGYDVKAGQVEILLASLGCLKNDPKLLDQLDIQKIRDQAIGTKHLH